MKKSQAILAAIPAALKWSVLAAAAIGIIIVVDSWIRLNTVEFEKTMVDQTNQHLLNIARVEAQHIDEFIYDVLDELDMVADNPLFSEYNRELATVEAARANPGYLPGEMLFDHMQGRINSFYRLNSEGLVLARIPFKKGKVGADYSRKPGVRAVIETHVPYISEVFRTNSGRSGFSICHPVFDEGEFAGLLRVVIHLEALDDLVRQIRIGETGYVWILDDDGRILASPDPDEVGGEVMGVRKARFPDFDWSEFESLVADMKRGASGVGIYESARLDGDDVATGKMLTAYSPANVGLGSWSIAVTMSYDEIAGPITRNTRNNFLGAAFLTLFFGAGCVFLYRTHRNHADLKHIAATAEELRVFNEKLVQEIDQRRRAEQELVREHESLEEEIVERGRVEKALRLSEEKYRALFEESKDAIFIMTPEGKFLDLNPATVEMFGYDSAQELLDIDTTRDLYVDSAQREEIKRVLAEKGFVKDYELICKRKDGKEVIAIETATTIRDEAGKIVGYRGIMRDVTERRHLEAQLIQAQKMESIGTLAGGIAHDFNNLLSGILGYASLAKTKVSPDESLYKYVDTIEKSGMRAAELTEQLLGFARGGKYNPKPVQLNDIILETLTIIKRTFDKSIKIENRLKEQMPAVEADAGQVQQVLMNLLVNAADAMPRGGKLTIESSCETLDEDYTSGYTYVEKGAYVTFSVTDTGTGIPKEIREKVFEPFFTTKDEGKGTGLGLSMVYGVIKNHGGFVHVYSEEGQGSLFKVYLPSSERVQEPEVVAEEHACDGTERVLVVDDEESIRMLAEEILSGHGYSVLLAEDGLKAVEIYERRRDIDLVVLDMAMPNLGGRETFRRLKSINPEVRAVLSTGFSQNGEARQIIEDGVSGFIQKPYRANVFLAKIRKALDLQN